MHTYQKIRNLLKANKSKKILTEEITAWLKNEIDNSGDNVLKEAFGNRKFRPGDYFFQADSLRLRAAGHELLAIFFDHEEFTHTRQFYVGEILTLSKHMNAPFYINDKNIILFSNEHIVMCKLAGNVTSWLNNFS